MSKLERTKMELIRLFNQHLDDFIIEVGTKLMNYDKLERDFKELNEKLIEMEKDEDEKI